MAFGTLISVYVSIDRGLDFSFVRIYLNVPQHRDLKRLFSLRPGGIPTFRDSIFSFIFPVHLFLRFTGFGTRQGDRLAFGGFFFILIFFLSPDVFLDMFQDCFTLFYIVSCLFIYALLPYAQAGERVPSGLLFLIPYFFYFNSACFLPGGLMNRKTGSWILIARGIPLSDDISPYFHSISI